MIESEARFSSNLGQCGDTQAVRLMVGEEQAQIEVITQRSDLAYDRAQTNHSRESSSYAQVAVQRSCGGMSFVLPPMLKRQYAADLPGATPQSQARPVTHSEGSPLSETGCRRKPHWWLIMPSCTGSMALPYPLQPRK
jgi:hypothetical protein